MHGLIKDCLMSGPVLVALKGQHLQAKSSNMMTTVQYGRDQLLSIQLRIISAAQKSSNMMTTVQYGRDQMLSIQMRINSAAHAR